MKKSLIIFLVLFMNISTAFTQNEDIFKLKTTEVAFKSIESDNSWSDWSDWEKANILVVADTKAERIKIFSKETQVYDVATDEGKTTNDKGDEIYSWFCVNEDGNQCRVQLWKRFYDDGSFYTQLYVNFSDIRFVYNLYSID
tara:strand:+ start:76 stop:501 length:426 start_codon:yes stop_codon:yes gene_type:complete